MGNVAAEHESRPDSLVAAVGADFPQYGTRAAHWVECCHAPSDFADADHGGRNSRPKGSWLVFALVRTMAHRSVRETQTAHRSRAVDRQPNLDGRILFDIPPAGRQLASKPFDKGLSRIFSPVAVMPRHLSYQVKRGLSLWFGADFVVDLKQAAPVRFVRCPS